MSASHCSALPANIHTARRPWALRLINRFIAANALHRQQQALGRLDDHMLRDIGVTRLQAEAEANRPVWDAPAHWRDK